MPEVCVGGRVRRWGWRRRRRRRRRRGPPRWRRRRWRRKGLAGSRQRRKRKRSPRASDVDVDVDVFSRPRREGFPRRQQLDSLRERCRRRRKWRNELLQLRCSRALCERLPEPIRMFILLTFVTLFISSSLLMPSRPSPKPPPTLRSIAYLSLYLHHRSRAASPRGECACSGRPWPCGEFYSPDTHKPSSSLLSLRLPLLKTSLDSVSDLSDPCGELL